MIVATTMFVSILLMCILILIRYGESSPLRTILIGILIYWFAVFGIRLFDILYVETYESNVTYVLEFRNFYGGMIALWIYLLYPTYAIYPKLYRSPNMLLAFAPFLITVVTYFIWCFGHGVYVSEHFNSYAEFLEPQNRVVFGFRIALLLSFALYYGVANYSLLRITTLYQRYIDGVYSCSTYNILWLNTYIKSLIIIGLCYFTVTIYMSSITYWIYHIGAAITFIILTDNALKFKQFERNAEYEVRWSLRRRWHVIHNGVESADIDRAAEELSECPQSQIPDVQQDKLFNEFNEWIEQEKPYCSESFTLKDVTAAHPEWDYLAMQSIFSDKGYTFQSYIRHLRINRAKELICTSDNRLPFKQIAYTVGFSHISSFNRAFLAELGSTPGEYRASIISMVD